MSETINTLKSGKTVSRHDNLLAAQKAGVQVHDLESKPEYSSACDRAFDVFGKISGASMVEISAYCQLYGETLQAWEIDLIVSLERLRQNPQPWGGDSATN